MTTPAGAAAGEFVDVEEWTWRARVQLFMRWAGKLADPWLDWRVRPLSGGNQTDGCVARQAEMPVLLLQSMRSALAGLAWSSQQPDAACRPLLVLKSVCLSAQRIASASASASHPASCSASRTPAERARP